MHPITKERKNKGFFYTLYKELVNDPEKFFNFTRMSKETFQELLLLIKDQCSKKNSTMRECIPVKEKLLITLTPYKCASQCELFENFLCLICSSSIFDIDFEMKKKKKNARYLKIALTIRY